MPTTTQPTMQLKTITNEDIEKVYMDLDRLCTEYALKNNAGAEMLVAVQVYAATLRVQTDPVVVDLSAISFAKYRRDQSPVGCTCAICKARNEVSAKARA